MVLKLLLFASNKKHKVLSTYLGFSNKGTSVYSLDNLKCTHWLILDLERWYNQAQCIDWVLKVLYSCSWYMYNVLGTHVLKIIFKSFLCSKVLGFKPFNNNKDGWSVYACFYCLKLKPKCSFSLDATICNAAVCTLDMWGDTRRVQSAAAKIWPLNICVTYDWKSKNSD